MALLPLMILGGAATVVWKKIKGTPKPAPAAPGPKETKFKEAVTQKTLVDRGHKKHGVITNGSVKVSTTGAVHQDQVLSKADLPKPEPGYEWREEIQPVSGDPSKDADVLYVYSLESSRGDELLV